MKKQLLLLFGALLLLNSCKEEYGANPFDLNTPITVSRMPKILSINPLEGETGDTISIQGVNFSSVKEVLFGGMKASSFIILKGTSDPEVIDEIGTKDTIDVIKAIVGEGNSGIVSITNDFGTKTLDGFVYISKDILDPNRNLALNKTATSSPSDFDPSLSNDGDKINSRWCSAVGAETAWWQVDFGEVEKLARVEIVWEGAYASSYEILTSIDGENFDVVYSTNDYNFNPSTAIHEFEDRDARYVKLKMLQAGTPWGYSFFELEAYGPRVNHALNKPSTSSHNEFYPSLANDGDLSTRWGGSVDDETAWWQVDLGRSTIINTVQIVWEAAYASTYEISVSEDGDNYTQVFYTNSYAFDPDNPEVEHKFNDIEARYVKIDLLQKGFEPWGAAFYEFEIY